MNLLDSKARQPWEKIGVKHHHGIAIALFSLLSEESSGIGEYLDLIPLIDFCKEIGFDVIQLLPLNDTGWQSSPYNAISASALNPIHLSISKLPNVSQMPHYQEKQAILRKYNSTPRIKYEAVRELKTEFLKEYYSQTHQEILSSSEYKEFVKKNLFWLEPYALFKSLKEDQNLTSWEEWPLAYKSPSNATYKGLCTKFHDQISFHIFLQFFCFKQLIEAKNYATEKGIFLKGDIPILINRDSADVWFNRRFFLLHLGAGAPPDMYAPEGQSWGFPVYDWEEIERSGFSFWKERLQVASSLYHIYRLDHVVGFFRIWAIPIGKKGTEGHFLPQNEGVWIAQGHKIMEMLLESAELLPIGEDLGTIPPAVRIDLRELGICGTKVMRWERRWNEDQSFINPKEYIPESMSTVSTHDSDTLQLWWRHSPKEALAFCKYKGWDYQPFLSLERHHEILKDSHQSSSLFHINLFSEYLALFPELVSANPNDERVNVPGKVLKTNWTYRLHLPIEKLKAHHSLSRTMRDLIS